MKNVIKGILSTTKYFFATSNRFLISSFLIIWVIHTLFSKGWYYLACILSHLLLASFGALLLAIIQFIIYMIFICIWSENKFDTTKIDFVEHIPYMTFSNLCCLLILYYNGTITW